LIALNVLLSANNFTGAVYIRGSHHWDQIKPEQLENLRRKRHVFITGTNDRAKVMVRRDYGLYKDDGIQYAKLIYETDRRITIPEPKHIDEALRYLDSR